MKYKIGEIYRLNYLSANVEKQIISIFLPDEKRTLDITYEGILTHIKHLKRTGLIQLVCVAISDDGTPQFKLPEGSTQMKATLSPTVNIERKKLDIIEGLKVEFKTSIIFHPETHTPSEKQLRKIASEIAAFMNTDGGDLYCGVDDEGRVVGIENDLKNLNKAIINSGIQGKSDNGYNYKPTEDGFSQKIRNIVRYYLGDYASSLMADPEFLKDEDKGTVYVKIHINPSKDSFVYFGREEKVYYRSGTSSVVLDGRDRDNYARKRLYSPPLSPIQTQPSTIILTSPESDVSSSDKNSTQAKTNIPREVNPLNNKLSDIHLPSWLDHLIYDELEAIYRREFNTMTVLDWQREDIKRYLGTYFPRSYAESYCIFSAYFKTYQNDYSNKSYLSILDFGCGTGGATMGLIAAIVESLPTISDIHIKALDGNPYALQKFEQIFEKKPNTRKINFKFDIVPYEIDDISDLETILSIMDSYDLIISFKTICEFVSKQQLDGLNPYSHILQAFISKLKQNGLVCLADITTKIEEQWLPNLFQEGVTSVKATIVAQNDGINDWFYVTHSRAQKDLSKIAWRIIKR